MRPRRVALILVPLVYYTPETRLAHGVAATATVHFRRDDGFAAARPSQLTLALACTRNQTPPWPRPSCASTCTGGWAR